MSGGALLYWHLHWCSCPLPTMSSGNTGEARVFILHHVGCCFDLGSFLLSGDRRYCRFHSCVITYYCFVFLSCPCQVDSRALIPTIGVKSLSSFSCLHAWVLSWPVGCGRLKVSLCVTVILFYLFSPFLGVSGHPRGVCGSPGDIGVCLDPGHPRDGVLVVERGAWPHLLDGLHEPSVPCGPPLPHPRSDALQKDWGRALPHPQVSWNSGGCLFLMSANELFAFCGWFYFSFWSWLSGWTGDTLGTCSKCSGPAWLASSPNATVTLLTEWRSTCLRRWCLDRGAAPGRFLRWVRRFRSPPPAPCWIGVWRLARIWIWEPSGTCGRGWPSRFLLDRWVSPMIMIYSIWCWRLSVSSDRGL